MDQDAHGTPWTRSRVEVRLIAAFRALPFCPVYTVGLRVKTVAGAENSLTTALSWGAFLKHDDDSRKYLWAWARCKAKRESFSELCRGNGWKQPTAERGRRRAADTIAARLRSTTSNSLDTEKTAIGVSATDASDKVLALT